MRLMILAGILLANMCAVPALAQATYELYLGGTQVTSDNASNVTGAWKKAGTISFDADSRTLTLKDAVIEAEGDDNCIRNGLGKMTVQFIGNNHLASVYGSGIYNDMNGNMTITGDSVKIETSQQSSIFTSYDSNLKIVGCRIDAKGLWGITGVTGKKNENLTIENATVYANGKYGSISSLALFTLKNSYIASPADAVWNADCCALCQNTGIITGKYVVIKPGANTGVSSAANVNAITVRQIYNSTGRPSRQLRKGVNILKLSDGTARKVIL